ncbi:MAG: hypothetical protein LAT64_01300 [Phycisphaerales bacterium]|nr:hypothetical protein [Planctomycetota bacterium]MCH8507399.1 hypothetical protein [Phycisphaerales bacterium]
MFHAPEIAVSLSGLPARPGTPWAATQPAAEWVRDQRVRGLALDASRPDCRARDLGRSARRDLAAMLRRTELELTGIDLFIPPEHYTDPSKSERAFETVQQTAMLGVELARLVGGRSRPAVSLTLPGALPDHDRDALGAMFEKYGAVGADHTPGTPSRGNWLAPGIDPASHLLAGEDPVQAAAQPGLAALRLTALNATGRCPVNAEGARPDMTAYAAAALTTGQRWITADTRGCADPAQAVQAAIETWRRLTALPGG